MKVLLVIASLMLTGTAAAQPALLEAAAAVRDEGGLERLVAASFGGGKHYGLKGSPFFVADLMCTSGIISTEIFVYEVLDGQLALRVHIPCRGFLVTKAEFVGGALVISEKSQREGKWKEALRVMPTNPKPEVKGKKES
jgi:hypothetical protein